MKVDVTITGLDQLREQLAGFSDRRLKAAVATALTRTAKRVSEQWQGRINTLDRPGPRTQKATTFIGANAGNLQATVLVKDKMAGTAPAEYLGPQETGGARRMKRFEQALVNAGAMPAGWVTVPSKTAQRDSYGNVSRSLIIAVLAQLGRDYSPGYARVISPNTQRRLAKQAARGRTYVAVTPAQAAQFKVSPGVYERMPDGSRRAVFLYQRRVRYGKRLDLLGEGQRDATQILNAEVARAIGQSAARLAARGAG